MTKHYRIKADPIEIKADPTPLGLVWRRVRRLWSLAKGQVARLLRLRTR